MKEFRKRRGKVIDLAVYDCFEGKVRILKNRRHRIKIEIIEVSPCYSCQKAPIKGMRLWIDENSIFFPDKVIHLPPDDSLSY